jgi:hypothetical protein
MDQLALFLAENLSQNYLLKLALRKAINALSFRRGINNENWLRAGEYPGAGSSFADRRPDQGGLRENLSGKSSRRAAGQARVKGRPFIHARRGYPGGLEAGPSCPVHETTDRDGRGF